MSDTLKITVKKDVGAITHASDAIPPTSPPLPPPLPPRFSEKIIWVVQVKKKKKQEE